MTIKEFERPKMKPGRGNNVRFDDKSFTWSFVGSLR